MTITDPPCDLRGRDLELDFQAENLRIRGACCIAAPGIRIPDSDQRGPSRLETSEDPLIARRQAVDRPGYRLGSVDPGNVNINSRLTARPCGMQKEITMESTTLQDLAAQGRLNLDFDYEKDGLELERLGELLTDRLGIELNRVAAFCLYNLALGRDEPRPSEGEATPGYCDIDTLHAIEKYLLGLTSEDRDFLETGPAFKAKELDYLGWRSQQWKSADQGADACRQDDGSLAAGRKIVVEYSKRRGKIYVRQGHVPEWCKLAMKQNSRLGLRLTWFQACALFMGGLQAGAIEGVWGAWRGRLDSPEVASALTEYLKGLSPDQLYTLLHGNAVDSVVCMDEPHRKTASVRGRR